jgi:hypothetical protein
MDNTNHLTQLADYSTETAAIDAEYGDIIPYDRNSTIQELRFYLRQTAESILEAGRRLILLKEHEPHGEFLNALDLVGIDRFAASRLMKVALKFSNLRSNANLDRIGKTKLIELTILDTEEIADLVEEGGTVRGLTLDDVDRMGVRELRAALRKSRDDLQSAHADAQADAQAKDDYIQQQNAKITTLQLQARKKIVADTDWPDALAPITDQVAAAGRKIAQAISELETCRITLFQVAEDVPADQRPKYEAALAHIADVYELALSRAERDLQKERTTYDKSLGAYTTE